MESYCINLELVYSGSGGQEVGVKSWLGTFKSKSIASRHC